MKNKLKTKIAAFAFCLLILGTFLPAMAILHRAKASSIYDEFDKLFMSTINEIFDYEETETTAVEARKIHLYDIDLQPLGIQYSFDYSDTSGFAIIIFDGQPVVTEIITDGNAPYTSDDLYNIYVSHGIYWKFDGTDYFDCVTGMPIYSEAVQQLKNTAYHGAVDFTSGTEQINYMYRSETKYNVLSSIPLYTYDVYGTCTAVAGTNLLAYYDKTYTNLIPNYAPGSSFLGNYKFKSNNETTNSLTATLVNDMRVNIDGEGATIPEFRTGLTSYINRQGYSVSFSSIMSSGNINFENAKSVVQNGKAIALFLAGFRVSVIISNDGYDTINYRSSEPKHAAAAFGCLEVNYTFVNNFTRTDKYIHTSIGSGEYLNGYINIATTKIDEALVINIS